jgi:hypothetical protein
MEVAVWFFFVWVLGLLGLPGGFNQKHYRRQYRSDASYIANQIIAEWPGCRTPSTARTFKQARCFTGGVGHCPL